MEMPSREEQSIVEEYVLERILDRPDTDIKKAVKSMVVYLLSSLVMGLSILYLFSWFSIFSLFPNCICDFREQHSIWFSILFIILVYFVVGWFCLKKAVIGSIRLYQHYAPEQIRRRCLFKPTCSEYSILAIQKYGLINGLIKTYIRLFKKCRGNIYRIDYP